MDKHSFHVTLASGEERDIKGDDLTIESGWLLIRNAEGHAVVAYGPGTVLLAELERRDDRG
jgi:hypothetical protein